MNDAAHQWARGEGIAQAFGPGANATVNYFNGASPKEVAELITSAIAGKQAELDQLAARLQVTESATAGFLAILKEEQVPAEMLAGKLAEIAQRHLRLVERLAAFHVDDPEAIVEVDAAAEILKQAPGREGYDRADALLAKAEGIQQKQLEAALRMQQQAIQRVADLRRGKAATSAQRGELAMLRLQYLSAAEHFEAASAAVGFEDLWWYVQYRLNQVEAVRQHYLANKSDLAALMKARSLCEALLKIVEQGANPLATAGVKVVLGNLLVTCGQLLPGTADLHEAVSCLNGALEVFSRLLPLMRLHRSEPGESAVLLAASPEGPFQLLFPEVALPVVLSLSTQAQKYLADALIALGERQASLEDLKKAEDLLTAMLASTDWERTDDLCGNIHLSLGNVLLRISERDNPPTYLSRAADAFRTALALMPPEQNRNDWAQTQNNLGVVLRREAQFAINPIESLRASADAFQSALLERSPDPADPDRAQVMHNLAATTMELGLVQNDPALLAKAVDELREALQGRSRDIMPLEWALTKNNLGVALWYWAAATANLAGLREAVTVLREALMERTRERVPLDWAASRCNLGGVLIACAELSGTNEGLQEARLALNDARGVFIQINRPEQIVQIDYLLAAVHARLNPIVLTSSRKSSRQ